MCKTIPKVIHYCWFGRNPLPDSARKCIDSWRKFFPDYEIKEWNEDNFDINEIPYTAEAYGAKKYAFVSDYARFKILYEHGGIYFDTDVEVIKSFEDILDKGAFMGCEIDSSESKFNGFVNPGLGLGVEPGNKVYEDIVKYYYKLHFILPDGCFNIKDAVVKITTRELIKAGIEEFRDRIMVAGNIYIYPSDYFNPFDDATGQLNITTNTHSIHWFMASWQKSQPAWMKKSKQKIRRIVRVLKR